MEKSEESATESETERYRRLWHECKRSIVELQFLKRGAEVLIVGRINRINTGKHHRLHFLKALNSLVAWCIHMSDGITHLNLFRVLDA